MVLGLKMRLNKVLRQRYQSRRTIPTYSYVLPNIQWHDKSLRTHPYTIYFGLLRRINT